MDALDLIAKIKMDISEYEDGLDKAKSSAEKSGSGISSAFGKVASGVGTAMATAAKVTVAAVTTAATAVGALTTQAVKNFAEFEQLEGGTELLYGEAADFIMSKSEEAYKTVQMSQNEYLEQVNGFATGLKTSLNGNEQAAAELADKIITAEADIVAATGNTQEAVQNAFNGIMKGNYTMLDNLQIGITPTKEGFQEVIDKVNAYNETLGLTKQYTIDNLADCEEALVKYVEMVGMSGYAQAEASQTISGSLSSMKAAWSNLVTGIANDEADLNTLTKNLVDTLVGYTEVSTNGVKTHVNGFLDNIIPVVETALSSIGTLIEKLVPKALDMIPNLITNVLPKITNAATELAEGLVSALSENMSSVSSIIDQLLDAFLKLLPNIITLGGQIVSTLASGIMDNIDGILDAAGQILEMIVTGISQNAEKIASGATVLVSKLITFLAENSKLLIDGAITLIEGIISGILSNLGLIIDAGIELAMSLLLGFLDALPDWYEHLGEFITTFIETLLEHTDEIFDAATTLFLALVDALPEITMALGDALQAVLEALINLMTGEGSSEIYEAALMMFLEVCAALPQILTSLLGALWEVLNAVISALGDAGQNLFVGAGEFFGKIGEALTEVGSDILTSITDTINGWIEAVKGTVGDWAEAGKQLIAGLWSGFTQKFSSVYDSLKSKLSSITSLARSVYQINSPSKVFSEIGSGLVEGLEKGFDDNIDDAKKSMAKEMEFDESLSYQTSLNGNSLGSAMVGTGSQTQNITLYATTTLDGKKVGESTYNFTVDKMNGQQRALAVAQGGYY